MLVLIQSTSCRSKNAVDCKEPIHFRCQALLILGLISGDASFELYGECKLTSAENVDGSGIISHSDSQPRISGNFKFEVYLRNQIYT